MARPTIIQQGATVKIMFVHVPSAWLAMFGWGVMSVAALGTLVWRHPLADVAGKAAAPVGAAFTLVCLVTGSLWGRPMWGTYWVWDARLTSVFILFLMYLGVIALWRTIDEPSRAARAAAILTLVGAINLPIIKFSVDWWNTLHQPASVLRLGGPAIHPALLTPSPRHGVRLRAALRHAASCGHAQRDPAPARAHHASDAGAGRAGS
jgi:heme exporter protein C